MTRVIHNPIVRTTVTISCVLLLPHMSSVAFAQSYPQGYAQPESQNLAPQLLAPDELDNLVAPIALYPDPLLSQVLAACTYPLEIVEAQQWLQQNRSLQGQGLIEAARQQNWDPSVQVLVAFPEAMALLSRDVRWTTDLGNAFLAQQADVMNAIQRLRAQASNNGRLATTPQQIVTTETQNEQSAIQIQPANPQVIYPPVYNPAYIWGPPASGAYPDSQADYESGYGFGSGINLGGLFSGLLGATGSFGSLLGGGALGGLGGWGWILNWFSHTLSLNSLFFSSLGFHNSGGGFHSNGDFAAPAIWVHNPAHRLGVSYSNGFLASRYRGANSGTASQRFSEPGRWTTARSVSNRSSSDGWHYARSGSYAFAAQSSGERGLALGNRMGGYDRGVQNYRSGFASNGGRFSENSRNYSSAVSQRMASNFSAAPFGRSSMPVSHFTEPRTSSPRFSSKISSSSQHFSARGSSHFSAPHGSSRVSASHHSGGGGHSGKGSHKH